MLFRSYYRIISYPILPYCIVSYRIVSPSSQDYSDAEQLLARENVDHDALWRYAYEAANFSTNRQLPELEFATNPAGRPDVAMFDFTCIHRAEHASLVRERHGKKLLMGLVGDSLVEVGPSVHLPHHTRLTPVQCTACSCFCQTCVLKHIRSCGR